MSYRHNHSTEALATDSIPWTTMDRTSRKMVLVVIPLGCMSSAAIASPILSEYRKVWLVTMLIFLLSTGIFVMQYPEETKTYGPFTLALALFLGMASYSSARTSLAELIPWIPIAVWLFVSLTIYFLPKTHEFLNRPRHVSINMEDIAAAEEGHNHGFQMSPMENTGQPIMNPNSRNVHMELNLRGIDRRSVSGLQDDFSTHDSDIDLQENPEAMRIAIERVISFPQTGLFTPGLSHCWPEEPHRNPARVRGSQLQDPEYGFVPRSTVGSASATSEDSMMPLLG